MQQATLQALRNAIDRIEGGFADPSRRPSVTTGLLVLDQRLPGNGLVGGAIHELAGVDTTPLTLAVWLTRQAAGDGRHVVWFDARREFYPPAAMAWGIRANRLVLVRPGHRRDAYWGFDQSLRCRGVAATVGDLGPLTLSEARRLQLAAEAGGGIGLLITTDSRTSAHSVAASRWRVTPLASESDRQRFQVEVVRCRGGRPLPPVIVEVQRGADVVALSAELAHRPHTPVVAEVPAA